MAMHLSGEPNKHFVKKKKEKYSNEREIICNAKGKRIKSPKVSWLIQQFSKNY
jgi:hypothetical protein